MIIERHNIIDLLGTRVNTFHSAILTCYTFDPIFFENYLLPHFRRIGIINIVILLDASNYDRCLEEYPSYNLGGNNGDYLNNKRLYSLVRQSPSSSGVFHPKISFFTGRNCGIATIGSGNLTYNGHFLNEEIWSIFCLKGEDSPYLNIFGRIWEYLMSLPSSYSTLINQQYNWMIENSSWLSSACNSEKESPFYEGRNSIKFIFNKKDQNILQYIKEAVSDEKVLSIDIVSPFIDKNAEIIEEFKKSFLPDNINCIFSKDGIYPLSYMKGNHPGVRFYSWEDVFKPRRSGNHSLHAKIFQITTLSRRMLILGSANFTTAGLKGRNDEACIFIENYSNHDYFNDLGINLNVSEGVSQKTIDSLSDPQIVNQSDSKKSATIFRCELIDNKLTGRIKGEWESCEIGILNQSGNLIICFPLPVDTESFSIFINRDDEKFDWQAADMVVAIDKQRNEVSNRCFIIKDDAIIRFNPDTTLQKLESLISGSVDWKANLLPILSFISFNDSQQPTSKRSVKQEVSQSEPQGIVLEQGDFDNIYIGGRHNILSYPSIKIVDFLLSSLKSKSENKTNHRQTNQGEGDIDADNTDLISNGDSAYEAELTSDSEYNEDISLLESIDKYAKRLGKFYDNKLKRIFSTSEVFGNSIFTNKQDYIHFETNIHDYSHILVHTILLWKYISSISNPIEHEYVYTYLRNLGKFHILTWEGYTDNHDYASQKIKELHRDLIVYTLMIITSTKSATAGTHIRKLSILNVLDSYRNEDKSKYTEILNLFRKRIEEDNIKILPESMNLIEATINEYLKFHSHRNDKLMVREIKYFEKGEYCYKEGYGFSHASQFKKYNDKDESTGYAYLLEHPGFAKDILFKGKQKILALR